ncbi:MAG: acyltransferase family protein [Actinobacteria bacterium]|nr:acyltransferase family protein [Actinomycetota bacterium]
MSSPAGREGPTNETRPLFDFSGFEPSPGEEARRARPRRHQPAGRPARSPAPAALDTEAGGEPELTDAFDPGALFASNVFEHQAVVAARVSARLAREPALDGLRGVAIIAVLLFLADVPLAGGGFLAISTFLTLTGFLVTRNLLSRLLNDEPLPFGEAVRVRLERLLPIAVLGVAAAVAYTVAVGDVGQINDLFGDVVTSLTFTANWRDIAQSQSYLSLLASPSATRPYWSLAVAEQANLVVLLTILGATASARRGRARREGTNAAEAVRSFTLVAVILLVLSIGTTLAFGYSQSRIYFGTDTRASEILLGALLAVVVVHRPALGSSRFAPTVALIGSIGAVALVALWLVTPISSPWVYSGGLIAYALVSAAVIAGCLVPRSLLATALAIRPLQEVGKLSLGLYVFALPVILFLSPERARLPAAVLFAVRMAVIAALAVAAHRFIEVPARDGRRLYGFTPRAAIGGTIAVIMFTTMATANNAPAPAIDLSQPYTAAGVAVGNGPATVPVFAVFGDSTAIPIQRGLTKWVESTNRAVSRQGRFAVGCGVVPGGAWQLGATTGDTPASCAQLQQEWSDTLEPGAPTFTIVTPGLLELANRRVPGDDQWRAIGVPEVELYYLEQLLAISDTLSSKGAKVVWLTMPPVLAGTQYDARPQLGQASDPARAARLNELIAKVAELRPDKVAVVDLAGWLATRDPDGRLYRPDGVHLSDGGGALVAEELIGPELLKLAGLAGPGEAVCAAVRTFGLNELAASAAAFRTRSQGEAVFNELQAAGMQVQTLEPGLNNEVETRLAYWSRALGLDSGDDTVATATEAGTIASANPNRLPETAETAQASQTIQAYVTTRCG